MTATPSKNGVEALLEARDDIIWPDETRITCVWERPVLIDNKASRIFYSAMIEQEETERAFIRDEVEIALLCLSSKIYRSWLPEYDFMAKMLSIDQLIIYAPKLVQLAHLMPEDLKQNRRKLVARYLEVMLSLEGEFVARQTRKFIRSSVLLYASGDLIGKADHFIDLLKRSDNQSVEANKHRIVTQVRALQLMTNEETAALFKSENQYLNELKFLQIQCHYYRIRASDLFKVSALKLGGTGYF